MGTFGGNGAGVRWNTHVFSLADHGEAGATVDRRDMGKAQGVISAGSGGNAVGNDLRRYTAGNRGTVGSVTAAI